jgi:drug/metabolite transporter (DMT)-like permease
LGYFVFRDVPDFYEILGSIIIVFSGIYIIYREANKGVRPFIKKKSRFRDEFNRGH